MREMGSELGVLVDLDTIEDGDERTTIIERSFKENSKTLC